MKIIEMERKTMDGKPVEYNPVYENGEDFRDWWCVIETEEEEMVYEDYLEHPFEDHLWNKMINHAGGLKNLCWGEDDIYGYFHPHEKYPEIGEEHTDADGDRWGRVE